MTKITKEVLLENGWTHSMYPAVFVEKKLPNNNPINDSPEDTDIKLILHGMYNHQNFAVLFPSGAMLNFVANTLEELQKLESMILFYDCEY